MTNTDRGYGPLCNHMYMYDLGWLVETILSFREELDTAIDLKTIHYADPIQWDITTQYSPNTVVVDPKNGTAYMSKVPVPAGVQLDNTDYWVVIFNYQRIYDKIMSGVAFNDRENAEASKDISKYDFVWFGGDLYQAQRDIPQGTKYVPGVNIVAATLADALATYYGRDRVAQVINDTLTASETQTIGAKNRVINVTGDQTVTAGDIAETSANRTIKTTADYHIDVDGNLSDHVDGVTTVNRGGAVTEAYGSSLDVGVTGTYTANYSGAVTETYKGKRNVIGKDINITASGNITASANQFDLTSAAKTFPIRFPDKVIDLYRFGTDTANIKDFGAVGDGKTDDTTAIQAAIDQTKHNTIIVPPGKYHTTKSIKCRDNIRIVGLGRNTCEFIDSFPSGTFTLANNVFFESLNFETDNNDGFAFMGDNVFAVNINHVDSLGGYFNRTNSKFLKITGNSHTILLNDCIIDCGTTDGYAIDITSDGDNSLNKDMQFRDVFCDTWYATTGGCIKSDSVFGLVLNNCIIRSHATCLLLDRRQGEGLSTCNAEFCYFDGDTPQSAVLVNGMTELYDINSVYSLSVHINLDGVMYYWDAASRLFKILYGKNAFTLINPDGTFLNNRANGSWDIVKPASDDSTNISLINQGLPITPEWDISYSGGIITARNDYARNGMYLLNSNGSLVYFGLIFKNSIPYITISEHTNAQTTGTTKVEIPFSIADDLWLSINHRTDGWKFLISVDGVSWLEVYNTVLTTYTPTAIGIAIDSDSKNAIIANVKQWHIETY